MCEKKPRSRLTKEQQVTLLIAYQEGWTQAQLAKRFGISQPAVSYIIRVVGPKLIRYE